MKLDLSKLKKQWNPFHSCIWPEINRPIKAWEIRKAGRLNELVSPETARAYPVPTRIDHIRRIAWLVVHPDKTPIEIDFGCPSLGYHKEWLIEDGNHRYMAAIVRGDKFIRASCAGDCKIMKKFLLKG